MPACRRCGSIIVMKKNSLKAGQIIQPRVLSSHRGEKISAVEGMCLTERMRTLLNQLQGQSGDERRALVLAQFSKAKG